MNFTEFEKNQSCKNNLPKHLFRKVKFGVSEGVTAVELIVTLSIVVILAIISAPPIANLFLRYRITSTANSFLSDLILARSEAARRGTPVTLCPTTNGKHCSAESWQTARLVFVDGSFPGQVDAGDVILRQGVAPSKGDTLTTNLVSPYIKFTSDGSANVSGIFTLCHSGITGSVIKITPVGRAAVNQTVELCS